MPLVCFSWSIGDPSELFFRENERASFAVRSRVQWEVFEVWHTHTHIYLDVLCHPTTVVMRN